MDYGSILDAVEGSTANVKHVQVAWKLVEGWLRYRKFTEADAKFEILHVEPEMFLWLDPLTLLIGRVDLIAKDAMGNGFFGEWKTMNPRRADEWRVGWRMSPQALTYGVLTSGGLVVGSEDAVLPKLSRFHVRVAFKSTPPSYDWDWFVYDQPELDHWRSEVLEVAGDIRGRRLNNPAGPWMPNFTYCDRYGRRYLCPYFGNNCSKLAFNNTQGYLPKVSHLEFERASSFADNRVVVVDASRIETYLNCHERYRQEHEQRITVPPDEALEIGSAFHAGLAAYYRQLQQHETNVI